MPLVHLERAVAEGLLLAPTVIRVDAEGQEEIVLHALRFLFMPRASTPPISPPVDVVIDAYAYSLRRVMQCARRPLSTAA